MKTHTFHWFLPTSMRSKTSYFEFDITEECEVFFKQPEYYSKVVKFDAQYRIEKNFTDLIRKITIKVYPFTTAPLSNTHEANVILAKEIRTASIFDHIIQRGNLRVAQGLSIIEIEFEGDYTYTENLRVDEETDYEKAFNWNMDFEDMRRKMISVASDICSFFLLGLHITYPTHSNVHELLKPQSSGLLSFTGNGNYIMDEHSDLFSYPILLEIERLQAVKTALLLIAQVWHKNIWSFYRFLKGVRSNFITIDNFLDLVFTLESFFDKNTSTEIMKLVTSVIVTKNKNDAKEIQQMLTCCFKIRNEVAHGGINFSMYDDVPSILNKTKERMLVVDLYWKLKNLNIQLLYYGIDKMIKGSSSSSATSIRFDISDISDKFLK